MHVDHGFLAQPGQAPGRKETEPKNCFCAKLFFFLDQVLGFDFVAMFVADVSLGTRSRWD